MLAKQGFNCKLGDNYDDQVIKIDSYKDPNGPNEPDEKEADPDPPAPKGTGTYEDISKAVFDSYKALVQNPTAWQSRTSDSTAKNAARRFKVSNVKWNEKTAALALAFENDAAPCDRERNMNGDTLLEYAMDYIRDFDELHFLAYEGAYTDSGNDVIEYFLKKNSFDDDQRLGRFDELGVGCTCNGKKGLECLLVFSEDIVISKRFSIRTDWWPIMSMDQCRERCYA